MIRNATQLAVYREAITARMKMIFSGNVSTDSSSLNWWTGLIAVVDDIPKARWEVYHGHLGGANP